MRTLRLRNILAISVLVVFLLAMVPAAWSDMGMMRGDHGYGRMGMGMGHHMIKSIEVPITVTGTAGNTTTFTVNGASIAGKRGKAGTVTFDKPLAGAYNMSDDMAFISYKGTDGMNIRVDTVNNSTVSVAGASAVLGIGRIKTEYHGKDLSISEFNRISVHLPDGSVKAYDLDKPVKVIKSRDRKAVVWDAYPEFSAALKGALSGGATFPADAAPMKVSDLAASEISATATRVSGPMRAMPPAT